MDFLYGTGNAAKLRAMRDCLSELPLHILGLGDVGVAPRVEEAGRTPLENARIKAEVYHAAFHMPVFSCDSELYFEELPEAQQPGLYVRRDKNGGEMTDAEMIEYYASLAHAHGGRLTARYKNAIYLMVDEQHRFSSMADALCGEKFLLCDKPHSKRVQGFPLDCLSLDCRTGRYVYDLEAQGDANSSCEAGFYRFFEDVLRKLQGG